MPHKNWHAYLRECAEYVGWPLRAVVGGDLVRENDAERNDAGQVHEHHHRLEYVALQPTTTRASIVTVSK